MDSTPDCRLLCVVDRDYNIEFFVLLREIRSSDNLIGKLDRTVIQDVDSCLPQRGSYVPWFQFPWMILVHDDSEWCTLEHIHGLELS